MNNITHRIFFWLPPIGYMIVIFSVSSISNPQIGGETPDYVLHALEYFLLALLLIRLFLARTSLQGLQSATNVWQRACLLGVIIAISYGIMDEIHQYFTPGRHCSLHDVVSDAVGAVFAYGVAWLDYLLLCRYPRWLLFLKQCKLSRTLSYTMSRF